MQFSNPFQMNDWEIKKFLKVVLAIQLAIWSTIGLDMLVLQIPVLRESIGFIYLTFIPGIVILRVLKLHKLGSIETLLYTVGLSIAFLMFTGLFMNTVYPFFGVSGPISITPLIITTSGAVLILCVLSYIRDRNFSAPSFIELKDVLSPPALFLYLIPFLGICGTYLVYYHEFNILLMLLIVVIVFVVCLVAFDKFIPKKAYPLAIFVLAIALLYHKSLISPYLLGPDIRVEYYFCKSVVTDSYWNYTIASGCNSLLSVTILPAIYSIISNIEPTWMYKIITPFILSLVPVGLYRIYREQTDEKIAFLATFFFISLHTFFITIPSTVRQQLAELFFASLIFLIVNKKMETSKKAMLSLIFGASLIVSHYGVSYIFMLYLPFVLLLMYFMRDTTKIRITGATYAISYSVMVLSWYIYISNAVMFETLVRIGDHIYNSIFTEFFAPEARDPIQLKALGVEAAPSLWREIGYGIYLVTLFFVFVGVLKLLLKHKETKFDREYQVYSLTSMIILLFSIALPFFATNIGTSRIYHLTLFFLSPFCIIGGETVFNGILRLSRFKHTSSNKIAVSVLVLIVLIPYFLFSSGFMFEVAGDAPSSLSLSLKRMKNSNDANVTVIFNHDYIWDQDVASAEWLGMNAYENASVWRDYEASTILYYCDVPLHQQTLSRNTSTGLKDGYVYLRYMNVVNDVMIETLPEYRSGVYSIFNTSEILCLLEGKNTIYDNGGSEIHK